MCWRAVAVAGLAAPVLGSVLVPAGTAAAATTVQVDVGVNGYFDLGDDVVVRVEVTADELVDGSLVASIEDTPLRARQDIQVPAGTTKVALLVLPGALSGRVDVELRDDDGVIAEGGAALRADVGVELVGVLPRLRARLEELPEQVTLDDQTGRAELMVLTDEVVALGSPALDAFDTIVGDGDEVATMNDAGRRSLLLWVHQGGRLLLDGSTDATGSIAALPQGWRPPADASYAPAGRGEVRLVDGVDRRWSTIVEPSGGNLAALGFGEDAFFDRQSELAERAGVRLPSLSPLLITLAIYGFVIGPVMYLVLRRARRLTLGWVAIPLVALVVTGGIVVAGNRFRAGGNPAAATYVEDSPVGAIALTNALTMSRAGGTHSTPLPPTWQADASEVATFGFFPAPATVVSEPGGTSRYEQDLDAAQVTTTTFAGDTAPVGVAVTATLEGDTITGTVSNESPADLRDVVVFVGDDATELGTVAAGQTVEWTASAPRRLGAAGGRAQEVWAAPFAGPVPDDQLAEFGIFGAASVKWELFPTGMATMVGWTDELAAPVDPRDDTSSRTAVAAIAPVIDRRGLPAVATVRASIVRSPFEMGARGDEDIVYRYVLPPDADLDGGLVLQDVEDAGGVEFWDGEAWIDAEPADAVEVPDDAVRDGVVLARVAASSWDGVFASLTTAVPR